MDGKTEEQMEAQVEQASSDPWAMAFAALDKEKEEDVHADVARMSDDGVPKEGELSDSEDADQGEGSPTPQPGDGTVNEDVAGGPSDIGGTTGEEDEDLDWIGVNLSEEEIARQRAAIEEEVKDRAISDVVQAYIKQGIRNTNGKLGATINDPDICKRDRDGIPHFYNPETGREFTSDNPRRDAQEWVDYYNKELSEAFNQTCDDYYKKLMETENGRIAIIEFAPKYKALDPIRRSMFESIIEDYEITNDNGDIIAYSCDLNKALAAVNRQVRVIQQKYSSQAPVSQEKKASGPVLDTPTTSAQKSGGEKPQFKSLAEAMEWQQDQLLNKKGGR